MRQIFRAGFARRVLTTLGCALWLAAAEGCAGINELTGPKAIPNAVATVEVPLTQTLLGVGASLPLQALVRDAGGRAVDDRPVTWSSSDNAVATVTQAGVVTAVGVGRVRIAASVDGRSAVASLTITPRAVASVVVQPGNPRVFVGAQLQLSSTMLGESGDTLAGRSVLWISSDPHVATIDNVGLLTGLTAGFTTVTATSESRSASVGVTVAAVPVNNVQITPALDSVVVGQATQLTASVRDVIGTTLTDRPVVWLSSDPATATVSSSGAVLGIKAGSVTISATAEDKIGTSRIMVKARPVSSIIVSPGQSALSIGQTVTLSVLITDDNGTLLTGRPVQFVSSNTTIAKVDATGLITAQAAGSAIITVTSEGKTGTASVSVTPSPVAAVRVDPATASLVAGGTLKLAAVALDGAGNALTQRAVTWLSGAPSVATVTPDGTVTALGGGTALIFATVEGHIGSATLTIRALTVGSVVVTPTTTALTVGDAVDLSAEVRESGGALITGRAIAWASSDERIAVVSSAGRVRSLAPGQVLITATVDGVIGSASVNGIAEPVLSITVDPASLGLLPGATATLAPTARGKNNVALAGRGFSFVSADPSIASVSSAGVVTAIKVGTTSIAVTSEGKSANVPVNITPAPVASVSVSLADGARFVGQTTQATSVAKDASGNTLDGRTVAWTSSNSAVATVNGSGVVSALAPGAANIIATVEGKTAFATVTVSQVPVASVSVVLANAARFIGQTTQATATTRDAGNNVLTGRAIAWTSSNNAIATVSATGIVTARAVGSANIIATSEGQTGFATVTVSLPPVASVAVTATNTTRYFGQTTQATAVLRDAQGNVLTGRAIIWSSTNGAVASVSQTGVVTALTVGNTNITATSEGIAGFVAITVTQIPVATVNVSVTKAKFGLTQNSQASVVTLDPSGNVLTGRVVSWSSSNSLVAFVSQTGFITGLSLGTASIIATSEGVSGSASVQVVLFPVQKVTVSMTPSLLNIGQVVQAQVATTDTTGATVLGREVTWSSSAPAIASVDNFGNVTALASGTSTITATVEGVTGSSQVVVALAPVNAVSITLQPSSIVVGATATSAVSVRDVSNNVLSGRLVTYSSSATAVATVNASGVVTAVSGGTATITATSEGKSGSATITVTAPVNKVNVTLGSSNIVAGTSTQATAVVLDVNNNTLTGRAVVWASSNTSVATVSAVGLVTAVAAGSSTISATSETKIGTAAITVTAALVPINTIVVTLASSSVPALQTTQATASPRDAANNPLTGRAIVWSSTNTNAATVNSSTGVVTAVAIGTSNITATSEGKSGFLTITVTQVAVDSVEVSLTDSSVTVGKPVTASAKLRDLAQNVITGRTVVWSTNNNAIATVDASGVVTTLAAGTVNIIGTSETKTDFATLIVSSVPVASVTVALNPTSITTAQTSQATASTFDAASQPLAGRAVAWSSGNTGIATVNASTGVVTPVAAGTTNIIATSEGKTGSASITVTAAVVPINSIVVTLASSSVPALQTTQATASPRDAANNPLTGRAIVWSSTNTNAATVNSSTGVVTAVAIGTSNITATSEGKSGFLTITVTQVAVDSVEVSLTDSSVTVGKPVTASAKLRDLAQNVITGRTVVWSTNNNAIATVDASGVVTTLAAGTVHIIAAIEGQTDFAPLVVSPIPVDSVNVTMPDSSINTSQTVQASALLLDAAHKTLTGRVVAWATSNESIATVDASTGLVTAVAEGTVNIIATSEGQTDSAPLTIVTAPVATVTVTLAQPTLPMNATTQATAVAKAANGVTLTTGLTVDWSSLDTKIATVDPSTGVVTAKKKGSTSITATVNGRPGSATVTVP